LDQLLPRAIGRVGLAGHDDLHRSLRAGKQGAQAG
jgi:hypothetical protein